MLRPGDEAPDFEAAAHDGRTVRLSDLRGRAAVALFFYPKDFTPVCTKEACGFRDACERLREAGVEPLGVSLDPQESHRAFAEKLRLPFPLLSDPDGRLHALYGVAPLFGLLRRRATFVIGRDGRVLAVERSMFGAARHVEAALAAAAAQAR